MLHSVFVIIFVFQTLSVLGESCSQGKHTAAHVLPGQKMPPQVLPRQQMPKATFSQTIYNHICVRNRLIDT